jgi:hypothetical protein
MNLTKRYACPPEPIPPSTAIAFCGIVSSAFVASLYLLVPKHIRVLHRDDARQIRWRCFATGVVSSVSLFSFQILFCHRDTTASTLHSIATVFVHTAVLYLGTIVQQFVICFEIIKRRNESLSVFSLLDVYRRMYILPNWKKLHQPSNDTERWMTMRCLVIAPIAEELVFRSCCVASLSLTILSTAKVVAIAPLFFGIAHVHHALMRLQEGGNLLLVTVPTLFQFAYTYCFGLYASFAYIKTHSVMAVTISHAFCNGMGIPDFDFMRSNSMMYRYRYFLLLAHIVGVILFAQGIWSWT